MVMLSGFVNDGFLNFCSSKVDIFLSNVTFYGSTVQLLTSVFIKCFKPVHCNKGLCNNYEEGGGGG